jgi:PAS domain S-box-containing protein
MFVGVAVTAGLLASAASLGAVDSPSANPMLAAGREAGVDWITYLLGGLLLIASALGGTLGWSRSRRRDVSWPSEELRATPDRQALHAQLLTQVADAIVATDADDRITTWNRGAETLFGYAAHDALGKPVSEVINQRRPANRDTDLRRTLTSGGEWKGDAEILKPSGETVFVEATVRHITDETGANRGLLLVGHDVDARRRAELDAQIRARQQAAVASLGQRALAGIDFELLLQQSVSLVSDTLQVYASGVLESAPGGGSLSLAAGQGWCAARVGDTSIVIDPRIYPCTALVSEAAVVAHDPAHELLCAEGIVTSASVAIPGCPRPYGLLIVADRRQRAFSRDDLHFLHSIANVIGASYERLIVERELRASVALQHATLEATAEGIVVTDGSGRVVVCNRRFIDMWGMPAEVSSSALYETWVTWGASLCAEPSAVVSRYRAAVACDDVHVAILALSDGRVFERHSQPQRVDGRIVGRVWCYRDLTQRVRAGEEQRRLETQMLQVQKLESLGVLAGGIAHDFNNLLVGMLGHAGLALSEVPAGSPVHERLVQLQTAAQRAAELTNQMLTYAGKGRFNIQPADISGIVEEMVDLLRTAVGKNARLHLDIARNLPLFEGDTGQVRQVIMNLITNASDAIGAAAGRIDVSTGLMTASREYLAHACVGSDLPEGDFVFAEVRDSGCGMDAATLERIFDPFFTTKFTGRGLGLAAALGIVRSHRGAIRIWSAPGQGTTFRVLLPASAARPRPLPQAETPGPDAVGVTPANTRVLIVDDEASVRMIASESLKRAGFAVVTAADGSTAVELVRQSEFHAVLLDLTMPGMSGVEVYQAIKAIRPDLPIVVTSGYSKQQTAARFSSAAASVAGSSTATEIVPMDVFIQKPFLPAALVNALRSAVSTRILAEVNR